MKNSEDCPPVIFRRFLLTLEYADFDNKYGRRIRDPTFICSVNKIVGGINTIKLFYIMQVYNHYLPADQSLIL